MDERDGEIVGLVGKSHGRSCSCLDCCGLAVRPDDIIRFKLEVLEDLGEVPKAVLVRDGTELCTVGFLPKHIVHRKDKQKYLHQFAQIIELYDQSDSLVKRRKDTRKKRNGVVQAVDEHSSPGVKAIDRNVQQKSLNNVCYLLFFISIELQVFRIVSFVIFFHALETHRATSSLFAFLPSRFPP